jgi:hypothetical protein
MYLSTTLNLQNFHYRRSTDDQENKEAFVFQALVDRAKKAQRGKSVKQKKTNLNSLLADALAIILLPSFYPYG